MGKVSALRGHETDGTPFNYPDIESIKKELESLGYDRNGTEYLYNGMTGKKMKSQIFIGPTYYQRLKHMVSDKIHARSRGPRTLLTRRKWLPYSKLIFVSLMAWGNIIKLREHPIILYNLY